MIDQIQILPWTMKNAPSFCSFIKKLYLCSKMSCTSMQITQVCRNQNSCQLITSFLNFPHKLFILSGLWDYSKNSFFLQSIKNLTFFYVPFPFFRPAIERKTHPPHPHRNASRPRRRIRGKQPSLPETGIGTLRARIQNINRKKTIYVFPNR